MTFLHEICYDFRYSNHSSKSSFRVKVLIGIDAKIVHCIKRAQMINS